MMLIEETVIEFGRSLGIEDLRLRHDGATTIRIDRIGTLAFELAGPRKEDVIVSLSRPIEPPDETACVRALELCHYRATDGRPVYPAWGGGALTFASLLGMSDFTLPNVHEIIDTLDQLHEAMQPVVRLR